MDNAQQGAPVIPAGTERTVLGTASFPAPANDGQAPSAPDNNQAQPVPAQDPVQPSPSQAGQPQTPAPITFEELARQKGFNSPDDLARSYSELESQNTRVSMGLSELITIREQSQPTDTAPALSPESVQTPEDAMKVISGIVEKQTRPLRDQLELQELFHNNPDARQLAPAIAQIVKDNPGIKWNTAYKAAKADAVPQTQSQAVQQGMQQAYQNIQQKQNVAVQPARPAVQNQRPIQEIIADRSIPFSEVQRIMRERFTQ